MELIYWNSTLSADEIEFLRNSRQKARECDASFLLWYLVLESVIKISRSGFDEVFIGRTIVFLAATSRNPFSRYNCRRKKSRGPFLTVVARIIPCAGERRAGKKAAPNARANERAKEQVIGEKNSCAGVIHFCGSFS